jgi:hypothetical protein
MDMMMTDEMMHAGSATITLTFKSPNSVEPYSNRNEQY